MTRFNQQEETNRDYKPIKPENFYRKNLIKTNMKEKTDLFKLLSKNHVIFKKKNNFKIIFNWTLLKRIKDEKNR